MRAEDILNALDHVDPALVGAADRKPRLCPKRLRRFAAAAACFALVLGLGFHMDTLGAGDSFAAGFLMRYLELKTSGACSKPYLRQCMEAGAELSAQTCMVHGAFGFGVPIE